MKRKDFIISMLLFVLSSLAAVHLTSMAMLNKSVFSFSSLTFLEQQKTYQTAGCGETKKIENLDKSNNVQLRKLAEYQTVCNGNPVARLMLFADMPNSEPDATAKAKKIATILKEFNQYGVSPLVVLEPITDWGAVDFKEFRNGFYDAWLTAYFTTLKQEGITDEQMGMWVPFPEANLPYWNHQNSKPDDFAANVTKTITIQKNIFPKSKASVMLNSATYENDDFDWRRGEYVSLLPYLKDIPKGLIDSFGLQGLPWMPAANQPGGGVADANEYLSYKLADEAAKQLGVQSIWFNTGTFGRKYTLDAERTITVMPEQRKDILSGVLVQAKKLRDQGYVVAVNLFAEDKSRTEEATDWAYWPEGKPKTTPDSAVFADFVRELKRGQVDLWLFDTHHQ